MIFYRADRKSVVVGKRTMERKLCVAVVKVVVVWRRSGDVNGWRVGQ